MAVTIQMSNRSLILHDVPRAIARKIDSATSYYVDGFYFAPSFKQKRWDGKEHLLKKRADGSYRLPSGMRARCEETLQAAKVSYKVVDTRKPRPRLFNADWHGFALRPYQAEATEAFIANNGLGILKMAIRSGKTVTAASVIRRLGCCTLFVVPSTMLLHQAAAEISACLGMKVGKLGDDIRDPSPSINVATIQTLVGMKKGSEPLYKWIVDNVDLVILDEIHHAQADTWRLIALELDSYWVLGLTATPPLPESSGGHKGHTKGAIWLAAIAGQVVYETNIKDLVEGGYLMRPVIEWHKITTPDLRGLPWSDGIRRQGIHINPTRNKIIVDCSNEKAAAGQRVLIVCAKTEHVADLQRRFQMPVPAVTGKTPTEKRQSVVEGFVKRETPVIISTVMGEGVNIPEVEVMINAAGGKSPISTVQRMRNLTKADGKESALVVDFLDYHNEYLAEHSAQRLRTYREQGAFGFKVIDHGA